MRPVRTAIVWLLLMHSAGYAQSSEKQDYKNIVLKDFDDVRYELKSIVDTSRVTILSFWASWCEPCRKELVELNRIARELHAQGVSVVTVNIDEDKDIIKAQRFLLSHGTTINVLYDRLSVARAQYGVTTIPRMFLIDRKGIVRADHRGFKDVAEIETEIRKYLR